MTKTKLNEAICKKMFVIGIPTSLLGFKYIREAILKCYEEPEYKYQITKGLYPAIAKQNGTTASRVERAMRHAIEIAWLRGDQKTLNDIFGYTVNPEKGRPTNSEFITMLVEIIHLEFEAGGE